MWCVGQSEGWVKEGISKIFPRIYLNQSSIRQFWSFMFKCVYIYIICESEVAIPVGLNTDHTHSVWGEQGS